MKKRTNSQLLSDLAATIASIERIAMARENIERSNHCAESTINRLKSAMRVEIRRYDRVTKSILKRMAPREVKP